VNLVYGPNESGKTHVAAALLAPISRNALSFFRSDIGTNPSAASETAAFLKVELHDASGTGTFSISPCNDASEPLPGINLQDCPQAQRLRDILETEPRVQRYWGPEPVRPRMVAPDWHRLLTLLDLNSADPAVVQFFHQASETPQARRSASSLGLIALADSFIEVLDHATPRPLIFEHCFGLGDDAGTRLEAALLRLVSLRTQVILLTTRAELRNALPCTTEHNLQRPSRSAQSPGLSLAGSLEELIESAFTTPSEPRPTPNSAMDAIERSAAPYVKNLDPAAISDDRDAYESIVDDLARSSASTALNLINAGLLHTLEQETESLLGPIWHRLHSLTKQYLNAGRFLVSLDGDQFFRLAVLAICIGIETEIRDKIFVPFVKLVRANNRTYPATTSPLLPAKPAESYGYLRKLIGGDIPHLALGAFPWILKAARQNRETALFADLMGFFDDRFGTDAADICYLVESIAFRSKQSADKIMGRILDIRNACAHGRADAFESATARELFDHIWGFAFREPLELLRKLSLPRSNSAA